MTNGTTNGTTSATNREAMAMLAAARRSLALARDDLDEAVQALPDAFNDNVMASPRLVALLLRVVTARRHLTSVEPDCALGSPGRA